MNKQPKPNECTCECHNPDMPDDFYENGGKLNESCQHCTSPSLPLEEKILEFREKFGSKIKQLVELDHEGSKPGGTAKEIAEEYEKNIEQFISEVIAEVRAEEKNKYNREFRAMTQGKGLLKIIERTKDLSKNP